METGSFKGMHWKRVQSDTVGAVGGCKVHATKKGNGAGKPVGRGEGEVGEKKR